MIKKIINRVARSEERYEPKSEEEKLAAKKFADKVLVRQEHRVIRDNISDKEVLKQPRSRASQVISTLSFSSETPAPVTD